MSRPLRISYPGAWYHVMNRGLARNSVFLNEDHYKIFLNLLHEIHNRYQVEIHAYCLMDNHYHLLIKTPLGNISRVMRHLGGLYTQRFNELIKRDGPIFRGRYKAILVEADEYLLRLSRYIHLNPVKANITSKAEDYLWSSYRDYLYGNEPLWLSCNETLNYFGDSLQRRKYKIFVEEGVDKEIDSFFSKAKRLPILGTEAFSKTITEKYLVERFKIREIPDHKALTKSNLPSIEDIIERVANFYKINFQEMLIVRKRFGNTPRAIGMYLSYKLGQYTSGEIAKSFKNVSPEAVLQAYKRVGRQLINNIEMRDAISRLEDSFDTA